MTKTLLILVAVLNSVDGLFTAAYLHMGVATEGNPAMALFVEHGLSVFLAVKILAVNTLVAGLFVFRSRVPWMHGAALVLALAYGMVCCYHFYGAWNLI